MIIQIFNSVSAVKTLQLTNTHDLTNGTPRKIVTQQQESGRESVWMEEARITDLTRQKKITVPESLGIAATMEHTGAQRRTRRTLCTDHQSQAQSKVSIQKWMHRF